MADRDTTPVSVVLDRKRPYRRNDSDRRAKWVGPGRVTVPKWVAEHWGMTWTEPTPAQAAEAEKPSSDEDEPKPPIENYDNMTADDIIHFADNASDEVRAAIVAYEQTRKRPRKAVIEELS
jgi:hypothetical protein